MKKIIRTFFMTFALTAFFGCGSTKVAEQPEPAVPQEIKQPEETVAPEPEKKEAVSDEYSRSVGQISVSKDTFEADKKEIMSIIARLSTIMKDFDYQSWLRYVDNESKIYWSQPANLKAAQRKLPIKGLQIKNLQDYFKYVFVPARADREVTSIRYVSDTYVKAVQVTSPATAETPEKYTVYYYFNKIDGHWSLHLPRIDE